MIDHETITGFTRAVRELDDETRAKVKAGAKGIMTLAAHEALNAAGLPPGLERRNVLVRYIDEAAEIRADALIAHAALPDVIADIADDQMAVSRTAEALGEYLDALGKGAERLATVKGALDAALAIAIRVGPVVLAGL